MPASCWRHFDTSSVCQRFELPAGTHSNLPTAQQQQRPSQETRGQPAQARAFFNRHMVFCSRRRRQIASSPVSQWPPHCATTAPELRVLHFHIIFPYTFLNKWRFNWAGSKLVFVRSVPVKPASSEKYQNEERRPRTASFKPQGG